MQLQIIHNPRKKYFNTANQPQKFLENKNLRGKNNFKNIKLGVAPTDQKYFYRSLVG
jgi:hypothetical protein